MTKRELEAWTYYAEGKTYKEIAKLMFIGEWTVKQYLKSVCDKLEMKPRACIAYLVKHNHINPKLNEVYI